VLEATLGGDQAAVKVDSCRGGSASDGGTEQVGTLPVEANSVAVEQVLVDPEAGAHVVIHHQVDDGTTRHIGVVVSDTVVELDHHLTGDKVSMKPVGSSRRTSDELGEHDEEAKSGVSVLSQLKVETLLTLSGRVETQLSRETTGLTVAVDGGGQSEQLAQHSIRS